MSGEPLKLLGFARAVMSSKAAAVSSVWPRCSALLARQALEKALDALLGIRSFCVLGPIWPIRRWHAALGRRGPH